MRINLKLYFYYFVIKSQLRFETLKKKKTKSNIFKITLFLRPGLTVIMMFINSIYFE